MVTIEPSAPASTLSDNARGCFRARLLFGAKLLLAAFLLWLLYQARLLDAGPLLALLGSPWLIGAVAVLLCAIHPLTALRWHLLLNAQQIKVAYLDVFKVNYAAVFLGLYVPGSVGADIARVALGVSFPRSHMSTLILSAAADRLLGFFGLLIVGLLASLQYLAYLDQGVAGYAALRSLVLLLGTIFAVGLAAAIVGGTLAGPLYGHALRHGWPERGLVFRFAAQAVDVARLYSARPYHMILAVLISVLVHTLAFAALALIAWGGDLGGLSLWKFAIAGAVTGIFNALSITPGGLGVGEIAFAQLVLWLEPASGSLPYATVFFAHRIIFACTLVPALLVILGRIRRPF